MHRRFICLWLVLLAALAVFGCSGNPEGPDFDNPFDPRNSEDPFHLGAAVVGNTVVLTWNHPAGYDITSYDVLRSSDNAFYETIATLTPPTTANGTFTDPHPIATSTSYYKLTATNSADEQTVVGQVTAAAVDVPLLLAVHGGATTTRTRYVRVRTLATGWEVARLSQTTDFADAQTVPFVGDSAVVAAWDLGPANANGDRLVVHACALQTIFIDGEPITVSTDTVAVSVTVAFRPTLDLPAGVTTVPEQNVDLAVGGGTVGITRLRLAPSRGDLGAAAWLPATALVEDYLLADTPQPQLVYGQFESEFSPALTFVDSQLVTPDLLTTVGFALDVPSNRVISEPYVGVINNAVATLMRFSTDPGFRNAPWLAYAPTATVALPDEPGFHVVYAQYRNHWTQSAVQTDWAVFSLDEVEIAFQDPLDGDVVPGGTFVELRGRAWSSSADAPVDSVKVNLGDGYVRATGTLDWSYGWDVPLLAGDTTRLLAARAYSHREVEDTREVVVDSTTALITVTISQLNVAITAPAAGAQILSGSEVAVTGSAVRYLNGAPLDSVVVVVDGERLRATGLAAWQTTWTAPTVGAITPVQLVARAFAGADSAQTLVDVTVEPAP